MKLAPGRAGLPLIIMIAALLPALKDFLHYCPREKDGGRFDLIVLMDSYIDAGVAHAYLLSSHM